jgi:hypothetical protein
VSCGDIEFEEIRYGRVLTGLFKGIKMEDKMDLDNK